MTLLPSLPSGLPFDPFDPGCGAAFFGCFELKLTFLLSLLDRVDAALFDNPPIPLVDIAGSIVLPESTEVKLFCSVCDCTSPNEFAWLSGPPTYIGFVNVAALAENPLTSPMAEYLGFSAVVDAFDMIGLARLSFSVL